MNFGEDTLSLNLVLSGSVIIPSVPLRSRVELIYAVCGFLRHLTVKKNRGIHPEVSCHIFLFILLQRNTPLRSFHLILSTQCKVFAVKTSFHPLRQTVLLLSENDSIETNSLSEKKKESKGSD